LRRMVSREHYLMYQIDDETYVRAGRFLAPMGLRQHDHNVYTRKYTGQQILEETYNLSAGLNKSGWELHATAFVPADPFTSAGPREMGGTVYYEKLLMDEVASLGGQTRVGIGADSNRYLAGFIGKYYFEGPQLLLMAEVDTVLQDFAAEVSPTRLQLASYLGLSYWPTTGVMLGVTAERYDEDLAVKRTFRDAYTLQAQYFPRAHFEIHALAKVDLQGEYADPGFLGLLMLHYYL
jgi:hypothetical protein